MSLNVYHELFVHLVWHTKSSLPLLVPELEIEAHQYIQQRCIGAPGIYIHGIGGTNTHLHLALSYAPKLAVSDIVKDIKGACAHEINKRHARKALLWQRGFGAVSFGKRNLDLVLEYIRDQKARHNQNRVYGRLERIAVDDNEGEGEFDEGGCVVGEEETEYADCPI